MTDQIFTCESCGGQLTGRQKMFCSKNCASRFNYNKDRKKHGRRLLEEVLANAACNQTHICKWCHTEFKPKRAGRTQYCSRDCRFDFIKIRSKIYKKFFVSHKVSRAKCVKCGVRFDGTSGSLYCSSDCGTAFRYEKKKKIESQKNYGEFYCKECGCLVKLSYGDKRKSYCSLTCSKRYNGRAYRKMERARMRKVKVEPVNPTKVFNRDGWRCQICGKKTIKSRRGSIDPRAPELDHIVPLSRGGEHSYANTQCTCRQCNARKSDTVYGQMPLFPT